MRTFDAIVQVANPLRHEPDDEGNIEAVVTLSVRVRGRQAEDVAATLKARKRHEVTLVVE
jgi:hypothetical protein